MKKIGDLTSERSRIIPLSDKEDYQDVISLPKVIREQVIVKQIKGPLFFGSTSEFQQSSQEIPDEASIIIFQMGRMPYMDQSGLYAMEDVLIDLVKQGKKIMLVDVLKQPKHMLGCIDIIPELIPSEQLFDTIEECLAWIKETENA